jgi:hypothetical protein
MATVEMTREYPVETRRLYDFCTDPFNWPRYYNNMLDATGGRFQEPGDVATCRYRILGRVVDVNAEVLEGTPGEHLRLVGRTKGLPDTEQDWHYESTATGTRVHVTLRAPEPESWFGRALDRLVIPRQFEKDIARTLDNIGELVAAGMIEEETA